MKQFNRLISTVLVVCMLFTLFTFTASAADETFTLAVTVPAEYASGTVSLYVGGVSYSSASGTLTEPASTSDLSDGGKLYTYEGISVERTMHLTTKANGITKKRTYYFGNIENVAGSTQNVVAEFYDKPAISGWHASQVLTYTHAMNDYMQVPKGTFAEEAFNKYVSKTPFFDPNRVDHHPLTMTTQAERINFIKSIDDADDNLYFFENIQRSYKSPDYYMNLVVFTQSDIPAGATMDDVAEIVKANGKPTILYKGQIHGNERAPGEATLAMVKALDTEYGEGILDKVNILVIPRVGVYTAYTYSREVASLDGTVNPNRDCMQVITNEMRGTYKVFHKFMPEIVIDAHEYTSFKSGTAIEASFADISYAVGATLNTSAEIAALSKDFVVEVRDKAVESKLFPYIYDDVESAENARYSAYKTVYNHPFYTQFGCVSFLVESPGGCANESGDDWLERRITSHFVAADAIFKYAAANDTRLKSTVKSARDKIISDGATFNEDDKFVLRHGSNKAADTAIEYYRQFYDIRTGTVSQSKSKTLKLYPNDKATRSRTRATAYFIPKSGDWMEKDKLASVKAADKKLQYERALETLDHHGAKYYEIPAGASFMARQYSGSATDATLLLEEVVTFENGGYVVPMNQVAGNVIGGLFEPDVTDNSGNPGTFMQQGLYGTSEDGTLPVYRYERDLSTTDLTYGGVTLLTTVEYPTSLTAVHKTTVDGYGAIEGLRTDRLYEYVPAGGSAYIPVRANSTRISHLAPGKYYVRYRYADGTFSSPVAITIEDNYTGSRFEFYNADAFGTKSYAMAGSKVLLTAIAGATYYRNGEEITDYELKSDIGAVALTVNAGLNNFSASGDGVEYGTVSVYGASIERYSTSVSGVGMHTSVDSTAVKYTTASPNANVSGLIDDNHTVAYQAAEGNITENIKVDATTTYPQLQQALGFYIDGKLTSDFRPIALTADSGKKCRFTPVIKAGGRLYVDTLGSGEIDTGITVTSDEWHDIGIFTDFLNTGMTDLYLDGVLVARGKIYTTSQTTVYVNSGDGPSNCYIGDAVNCVVVASGDWPKAVTAATGSKVKMFSNRTSLIKVYPAISIAAGSEASSVKVALTDFGGLTDYTVKLFVNGEMVDTDVVTDGTDTAISLPTLSDMRDSSVYAAVVDSCGKVFNGFSGPLMTDTLVMDIATDTPVPIGLVAVHKTVAGGKGAIAGLDPTKLYEYALVGAATYTPVAEGADKIADLAPGTYYVRFRYEDGTFSPSVEITIENQYVVPAFELYNPELLKTYAMQGSKVLFKAIEGADYYRNGAKLNSVEAGLASGTVALPVVAGNNSFYAVIEDEMTNVINIYGATMADPTVYKNLFTDGTTYGDKFGWKKVTDDGSNPTLFDGVHTDIRQQGSARTNHNVSAAEGKYPQGLVKLGFYVDGDLAEDSKLIALATHNTNSYYARAELNTDMTLDIVTPSSVMGIVSTGITLEKNRWYSLEVYYDININNRLVRQMSVYLDGVLIASGIRLGYTTGKIFILTPNKDANMYFSSAAISTVETTANPAYNISGDIAYDPTLAIEQGETANTVKVTGSELNGLENLGVRLFVNGEMIDTKVKADGTPTTIKISGDIAYEDAEVYAAVVDAFGNVINGLDGAPLKTETVVMDITPNNVFTGSIASGKVSVKRSDFPEEYKTSTAIVIESKEDGTFAITEVGAAEETKEISVATTSKKIFLWILSNLYPLCEAIIE